MYDALLPEETALLQTIFEGFTRAGRQWPIWQYVRHQFTYGGFDAAEVLNGLRAWGPNGYRAVRMSSPGLAPRPDESVRLTFLGLHHVRETAADGLNEAVVAVLQALVETHLKMEPSPTMVRTALIAGTELTQRANSVSSANLTAAQLYGLLETEPPFWGALTGGQQEWSCEATNIQLPLYSDVRTPSDLITVFDASFNPVTTPTAQEAPLPPQALPDALDHFNLAWQVYVAPKAVLRLRSAAVIGALTLPARTAHEFAVGVTALADVISAFDIPTQNNDTPPGSLNQLAALLAARRAPQNAVEAIAVLRAVIAVRNAASHPGSKAKFLRAYTTLGVDPATGDWAGAWDAVRRATVSAFGDIRMGLERAR